MPLPVNKTRLGLLLLALVGPSMTATAESLFDGWYQVDTIIFKPRSASVGDESWPELNSTYPADVVSIYDGDVFSLSQLEQAGVAELAPATERAATLSSNEFAFATQSNRTRNQRIIEAVSTQPNTAVSERPAAGGPAADGPAAETSTTNSESADTSTLENAPLDASAIARMIAEMDAVSPGKLAFSSRIDDSTLKVILRSLNRSSRYDVLDHRSWVQPINNEPTPILVQTGKRYDDRFEVEGTLTVNRSRFLHVQTDLWYTVFEPKSSGNNPYRAAFTSSLTDEQLAGYEDLVSIEQSRGQYYAARVHRMSQSRRMRSDELHYIDHPLFGVIVRITRFDPESESDN